MPEEEGYRNIERREFGRDSWFLCGTVQVVLWHPGFVVLGSDTARLEEMKSNAGYGSKIVCHDTLPLAIAVGGMAEFTVDDKETVVIQLLREQFASWKGRVNLSDVMRWGTAVLLPLVKEANAAWPDEPPMKVSLIVGLCNGGRAESSVVEIQNGVDFVAGSLNKSAVNYPATLPGWYADRFVRGKPDPFRDKVHDPAVVVAHAKEILEDAIKTDKRRSKGRLPHCGGHAEVVIVDSEGARFVRRAPTGS